MPLSEDRRHLLERRIRQGASVVTAETPGPGPRTEPASYGQVRLWFLEQLQQVEVPYTLHAVQRLPFQVDRVLLERAINEIVRRHEVLRTTFGLRDEELVQHIAPEMHVALCSVDLGHLPEEQRQPEALRQMGLLIGRRFDLEHGPLLRTALYRLADTDWLLLLTVHHIVFDWPSFPVFFKELDAIYGASIAGRSHGLPTSHAQYAAFAREQRARLTPERIADEVRFWTAELAGVPMLDLPVDRPRSSTPTFRGGRRHIDIAPALVARLQRRGAQARATLFIIALAGLWAALSRLCAQDDFAVGLPVTGRDTHARQEAIGFYVDTVVVRARLDGDPTSDELVAAARAAVGRSLTHRSLPFEMLVQHLQPERDLGVNPYFQVGFQLMQYPIGPADADAMEIARSSAMFDLGIDLWMQGQGIGGRVEYKSDLFNPPTIDLFVHVFLAALEWLLEPHRRLSELRIGAGIDPRHASILHGQPLELVGRSCLDLIADVARRHPELPALEGNEETISYGELMGRIERLSAAIVERGVAPGSLVVVELERSPDLVCLQLALMSGRIGFACVDPAWPRERRTRIFAGARPHLVIDACEFASLQRDERGGTPPPGPDRGDVAYVIFTSGSSGQPKGVVVEHAGLLNVAYAQRHVFGLGPERRVAQLSSPTFDASIFETVLALCSGATLVVAPPGILAGEALEGFIERHAVDTVVLPPSLLATVRPGACLGLRLVCAAGESCPSDLMQRFREGCEFWNLYGPTETTIWATFGRDPCGSKVSIGRPIANLSTAVVDAAMNVVPTGVVGELCVAGVGLAQGYLNRPDLTRKSFVDDAPGLPGRLYRTGDLVRQTDSGKLIFLGRADRQIKVRALRIEPEEVEIALRGHPEIDDVVVGAFPVGAETALVAYLQCAADGDTGAIVEDCRLLLRERLPAYMCPSHFVVLPVFPRTSSGKIDLRALPPPTDAAVPGQQYVAPATPTERQVVELMMRAAHASRVSATDDFFHIGGHSLAAVQLASRARSLFKVDVTLGDVFAHSTVSALAARIDALVRSASAEEEAPLVRLPRGQRVL
jgi:amino acid adenylation domain-containing protein